MALSGLTVLQIHSAVCWQNASQDTAPPHTGLLVLREGDRLRVSREDLLVGFALLPVGQEHLVPQELAMDSEMGHMPQGRKVGARQAKNYCSLCLIPAGPK